MKHRLSISFYVHKLPEASDGRGATVSVWQCRGGKRTGKNVLCDITPTMPHWFKLPIILSSRARRFERMRRLRESNLCSSNGGLVQAISTSEMQFTRKKTRERFIAPHQKTAIQYRGIGRINMGKKVKGEEERKNQ